MELFECLRRALNQQWIYHDPDNARIEEASLVIASPSEKEVTLTASIRMREVAE
jgi:hypothetical protein